MSSPSRPVVPLNLALGLIAFGAGVAALVVVVLLAVNAVG